MLSKPHRIRTSAEYDKVYKHSRKLNTPFFRVYVRDHVKVDLAKHIMALPRFGVVASKKVGNAVKRNKAKRLMREVVKNNISNLEQNFEAVIVLYNTAADATLEQLDMEFKKVLEHKLKGPANTPALSD